ncbi:MAG: hypothetical protein Ta2E_02670 [Mycoplasmoidaceae bacterium]|nr:MAG: hypothetical protein Ta2E_02670 [Mycoplasmoidaceae bacterium]
MKNNLKEKTKLRCNDSPRKEDIGKFFEFENIIDKEKPRKKMKHVQKQRNSNNAPGWFKEYTKQQYEFNEQQNKRWDKQEKFNEYVIRFIKKQENFNKDISKHVNFNKKFIKKQEKFNKDISKHVNFNKK